MRIGILTGSESRYLIDSIRTVYRLSERELRKHQLLFRGDEYWLAPDGRKDEINRDFLASVDVILGPVDGDLLVARSVDSRRIPYLCFLEGSACRGLPAMRCCWRHLSSVDVLIGNCTGDEQILRKFFGESANIEILPFPYDDLVFYRSDEYEYARCKHELGISPEEHIVLYAGRVLLEKNLHTSLKVFSVLQSIVPHCHFLIVGEVLNTPFFEFGIHPVDLGSWLQKLVRRFNIDPQRVRFLGKRTPAELRGLYGAADVTLNLTLHHDENFGLAQVESMACGTPVVGSHWGGLKDTIQDRRTGYSVDTSITTSGLKVDWLSAVASLKLILQLSGSERNEIRKECLRWAQTEYSARLYGNRLESILNRVSTGGRIGSKLSSTPFAQAYWQNCAQQFQAANPPVYVDGQLSFELYRALAEGYAGFSTGDVSPSELGQQDVLYMTCEVKRLPGGCLRIDDPISLKRVPMPADTSVREAATHILWRFDTEPAITFADLRASPELARPAANAALEWLMRAGLVTKCSRPPGEPIRNEVLLNARRSFFSAREVNRGVDAVIFRERPQKRRPGW